jgi:MFS family permease
LEQAHLYPGQRRNFLAYGSDFLLFSVALAFLNLSTVLPAFVNRLTGSAVLVGLVTSILQLSSNFPQLYAGNFVTRFPRKQPVFLVAALIGRPAILLLAILVALTGAQPAWLTVGALYLTLVLLFGTDSFSIVSWLDIMKRAFPPGKRGRLMAVWQGVAALAGLGVAYLVSLILGEHGPPFPYNYALIFACGGVAMLLSVVAVAAIDEPPPTSEEEADDTFIPWAEFRWRMLDLWKRDARLRLVTLSRLFVMLTELAVPFYVIYATDQLGFPVSAIGVFIVAQTVSSLLGALLLGGLADQLGAHRASQLGVLITFSAPLLALILFLTHTGPGSLLRYTLPWVYLVIGQSANLFLMGHTNYTLDIAPRGQTGLYVGVVNTVSSLGVFAPLFAGWLLSRTSYGVVFGLAVAFGLWGLLLTMRLPVGRGVEEAPSTAA